MRISSKDRNIIKNKFGGKCAYSGTPLMDDWQVDHIAPIVRSSSNNGRPLFPDAHNIQNMVPCQRVINKYKGSLDLESFRSWYLAGLHERLKRLPRKTNVEATKRRIKFLREVAKHFGISEESPFSGIFYFEKIDT
jgi:5-methylcytosine-specific restriction endonuclease McrA